VPNPYTKTLWNESFASYSDGLFPGQTRNPIPAHALTASIKAIHAGGVRFSLLGTHLRGIRYDERLARRGRVRQRQPCSGYAGDLVGTETMIGA